MNHACVVQLSRELRFSLVGDELAAPAANNFAGNPPARGLAPFCTLQARVTGQVDATSGMLMNIREMDRVLRQVAVPVLVQAYMNSFGRDLTDNIRSASDALVPIRAFDPALLLPDLFERLVPRFLPRTLSGLGLGLSPFYFLYIDRKEHPMIRMTRRFEFSAAHRLHSDALSEQENIALFGKCNNLNGHGHNYELEVTIGGRVDAVAGELMPTHTFQHIVNERIIQTFDHKHLNLDCPQFARLNPTVENIAQIIFDTLRPAFGDSAQLLAVKVWETPKTWCEVTA